jgi:UDP-2-acetamido-3-amino-2,3-dideoxy-glucuronate N-acetyltransferase
VECEHFLHCVQTRETPRTDGNNGVEVLRILQACEESVRKNGKPVDLIANPPKYYAHPTAVVDEPCEIGEGSKIWHFSHVMANSKLGKNCNLGQNVVISPDVIIGNNVKIQNNVSVYTGVILEDDVFCGPSMVFTNVVNPRSHILRRHEYRQTLVKRGASFGANCTVVCGHSVGQFAFVAAGAVVAKDVPDYALMAGVPAKRIGWMCYCGIRLKESGDHAECPTCGKQYHITNGVCREVSSSNESSKAEIMTSAAHD